MWQIGHLYPEGTVGRLMERPLAVYRPETTVGEAIESLRDLVRHALITYVFVTDAEDRLVGVLAFRDLLFAERGQRLEEVMLRDPFSLQPTMPLVDAMRAVVTRHFPAYPVTDARGRLVGLVRGQALFERQAFEISAQAGAMVGVEKEERVATPWWRSFRFRHPWLQLNLLTAFVAAAVVGFFQDTVDRIVVLAAFLPVLAGQSGNTGCQALAVTLRGMTLGELRAIGPRKLVAKEAWVGFLNGAFVGLIAGGGMWFYARSQETVSANPILLGAHRLVRDDRLLRRQRHLGGPGAADPEAPRRRPRHRVEHLPHHRDRRGEHGAAPRPGDAAGALKRPEAAKPDQDSGMVSRSFFSTFVQPSGLNDFMFMRFGFGVVAQVLLVDDAGVAHHERHDSGVAVLLRVGEDGEPADLISPSHVVVGPAGRGRALRGQKPVAISVIAGARRPITLRRGGGHELADRALRLALFGGPEQAVPQPDGAAELLRVLEDAVAVAIAAVVFALPVAGREAGLDGAQLVAADAAVDDLFDPRLGIERPAGP